MAVTSDQFRLDFPAFADDANFPDTLVDFWLKVAGLFLNVDRWGTILDVATELYVAHNLSLEGAAIIEAANGLPPGQSVGIVNSKSIDKVSVGYDVSTAAAEGASHWNKTIYGARLWRLILMFGAGPIQLSGQSYGDVFFNFTTFNGWPGPIWNGGIPNLAG